MPGGVMFAAIHSQEVNGYEIDIGFTDSISNVGQGFDVSSGVFTAPVTGTFEFSFSALTGIHGKSYAFVDVIKNGAIMFRFGDFNEVTGYYNSFGHVWQSILQKGDEMKLRLYNGAIYANPTQLISFIGHLVAE
jgi:hypothetical protein